MKLTIIRDDGVVGVDGVFRPVDLSKLPADVAAVQWSGASGHVEIDGKPSQALKDIAAYQPFVDLWTAAAPLLPVPPAPLAPPTLDEIKANRIAALSADCAAHIYAGFVSSALGAPHTYPANDKDQANLSASVLASMLPGLPANWATKFWCKDAAGVWEFRPHAPAQIQRAGLDGKAAIETALQKNATLAAQVKDAADGASVAAIRWAWWSNHTQP